MKTIATLFLTSLVLLISVSARADDYVITLKDHQFAPNEITIPANEKIKLTVQNQSTMPAEFESSDLDREKIVAANNQIIVFIGPLAPGRYGYFDDFHRETTGTIIAK